MLREIVKPTKREIEITLPQEYVNQEVEILVLPLFEIESPPKHTDDDSDDALAKLFKNAPNVKVDPSVDIDGLMNEVNDVVL